MDFLEHSAPEVAAQLLGYRIFAVESDGTLTGGVISETEAYTAYDGASHSYRGMTERNKIMFGPAGHVYVYFSYGMHWCMNIVTGQVGDGEAVLLRALIPSEGLNTIRTRRNFRAERELTNGPAKVCQALGVTGNDNGAALNSGRFVIQPPTDETTITIAAHPRIGISRDTDRLWRFTLETSPL